jgi:hypothetical protein
MYEVNGTNEYPKIQKTFFFNSNSLIQFTGSKQGERNYRQPLIHAV